MTWILRQYRFHVSCTAASASAPNLCGKLPIRSSLPSRPAKTSGSGVPACTLFPSRAPRVCRQTRCQQAPLSAPNHWELCITFMIRISSCRCYRLKSQKFVCLNDNLLSRIACFRCTTGFRWPLHCKLNTIIFLRRLFSVGTARAPMTACMLAPSLTPAAATKPLRDCGSAAWPGACFRIF